MATEQEVLGDLIQAITNTNTSNDDFLKVLKEGRDQDVALRDGTVVPSLTKRVVNAFSNSDYLMKADNLASVIDKQEARGNLGVYSKTYIDNELLKKANVAGGVTYFSALMNTLYVNANDFDITIYVGFKLPANANANVQIGANVIGFCTNYNTANVWNFYTLTLRVPAKATYKFNVVAGNPSVEIIGWQA